MRPFACFVALIALLIAGFGQTYTPKKGETVLKLEVEGRGNVFILLHTKEAPKTTARILQLVSDGFYNSQRFHRAIRTPKPYLVQVGDPASKTGDIATAGTGGSGKTIPFEDTHFGNLVGAVGLARQNPEDRNSGDSQFYILLDKAHFLDDNYCVFGQVVAGMDVVKKIQLGDRVVAVTVVKPG